MQGRIISDGDIFNHVSPISHGDLIINSNDCIIQVDDVGDYEDIEVYKERQIPFPLLITIFTLSLSDVLTETADMGMSLSLSKTTPYVVIPAALISIFAQILSARKDTVENAELNYNIIRNMKLPYHRPDWGLNEKLQEEWPLISKRKEILAIGFTGVFGTINGVARTIETFYFGNPVPDEFNFSCSFWPMISGTVTVWSACTAALDILSLYKLARQELAGMKIEYANTVSKFVSPVGGVPLGGVRSLQNFAQRYIALKTVFNVDGSPGICIIGTACIGLAGPNSYFDWQVSTNLLNDLFGYIQQKKFEPLKLLSYGAALAIFAGLEYLKKPLNIAFCQSVVSELLYDVIDPDDIPDYAYEIIAWGILLEACPRLAMSLQPYTYLAINYAYNKLVEYGQSLLALFTEKKQQTADDEEALLRESDSDSDNDDVIYAAPDISGARVYDEEAQVHVSDNDSDVDEEAEDRHDNVINATPDISEEARVSKNRNGFFYQENTFNLKFRRPPENEERAKKSRRCIVS